MLFPHPPRSYELPEPPKTSFCYGCVFLSTKTIPEDPNGGYYRCGKLALRIANTDAPPTPLRPGCKRQRSNA